MPVVFIEGVGRVRFPDSMTPQEIEAEIQKMQPPARQPAAAPQEEMGGLERFGRGALQSLTDIGFGTRQLGAEAGAALGLVEPETVQRLRQEQEARAAEAAPFMDTGAGRLGYMAGSIGSMLLPGAALGRLGGAAGAAARGLSAPTTFAGAAGGGALMGAVQPVTEEESRATNVGLGLLGGTVGQAVGRGVSRLARPVTSAPAPEAARAIGRLQQAGVPVDVAEQMGSENLRLVRRFLTDNPISAGTMRKGQEAQQTAFNRAALRLIGEEGDAAVPQVLASADDRIGSVMDSIARKTKVKVDDKMVSELAALEEAAGMTLEPAQLAPLRAQLNNILSKLDNEDRISGEAYQRIRTIAADLGKNPAMANVSRQLRETIDSALERTAGKDASAAIKQARKQYRNLKLVEQAVGLSETGDISVPRLAAAASTKRQRGGALYGRGDADMARLARSAMTVRDAFPQSGTAPRAALQALGGSIAPGAGLAAYSLAQGEPPSDAAMLGLIGGAAGLATPALAARAFQNPAMQQYLMRGVQNPVMRRLMMSPATRGALTYLPAAGLLSAEE